MSESPRWPLVEELFDGALDQPAEARVAWLAQATSDAELRALVARMLAAHVEGGGLLDRPLDILPDLSLRQQLEHAFADRYTIEREIGRGGMAVVYLARERKHDRQVVIKVLNPEASAAYGSRRFLDEIQVIAQLAHPNILPLIDSGSAVYGGDGAGSRDTGVELLYYVMPYLGGQTLRTRLRDEGRLPPADALRILCDVAGALASAHQAGVVHRDLKPENILLVGEHAYLLDFGIALLWRSGQFDRHTGEGLAVGTVGYMAPEQSVGGKTTAAADVYAWGVLARELLTGRPPDVFRSFLDTLPDGTPPGVARLIRDCLVEDPEARPRDALVLVERLGQIEQEVAEPPARHRSWPWVAAALLVLGTAGWLAARTRRGMLTPGSLPQPVAVQSFRNETGDSALAIWGRLAGDWVTQGLQEAGVVRVVPWNVSQDIEHHRNGGDPIAAVRAETGAGTVITGAYYLVGDRIRFQAEVVDAVRGTVLAAPAPAFAPRDSAEQAIQMLRARLMAALAIRADEDLGTIPGLAERPPTFAAYQAFDRGTRLHLAGQYDSAAAQFREAFALDTTFAVALVHAAFDLWNTGDYATVDTLLMEIRRRQVPLSPYYERISEYLRALLAGDGLRALATMREASDAAPHTRGRYTVAWSALGVNRPYEARALLASLDPRVGMLRNWAPYWTQRAHAEHLIGDHGAELAAVRAMRAQHPDSRVAVVLEVRAAAALGREGLVDTILAAASSLPPDTYWSYGAALVVAGEEYAAHGRTFLSNGFYKRAISWLANQLTRDPANTAHRYWLGAALYDAGRWPEAQPYFRGLAQEFPDRIDYRGLAALTEARAGRFAEAEKVLGPRPRYSPGAHTSFRARLAAIRGNYDEALTLLSQAIAEGYTSWPWFHAVARRDFAVISEDPRYRRLMAGDAPAP